ncbi:phospholipase A1-like isoform X1 [Danaus plexippus]|uniref:phospholipase A1-like isoform X1 n=1 Tax=Danaus plexippus TaxID=13037 RepID=UPI002AB1B241|nr:phospholipase A1-like isoform X1 [Danaus plexippus]
MHMCGRQKVMYILKILTFYAIAFIQDVITETLLSMIYERDRNTSKQTDLVVDDAQVFFYDFQNNINYTHTINYAAETLNNVYNLDVTRQLIVFIPGYKSHINRNAPELIKAAFKDVPNIYLIVIDHSIYTSSKGGRLKSYERSVTYTYPLGVIVGEFLAKLRNVGFSSKNIHCIGHSLGGQILGYAGTKYFKVTAEKIWRITGIDPAGPCFSNSLIDEQLRSGVAEYVEVYHCNAGGLGTTSVLADIDFFINNGKVQPNCDGSFLSLGDSDAKCSHKSCVKYWTETVQHPGWYLAWKCDSYKLFSEGKCAGNEVTIGGYTNPGNSTGVFYISTEIYGVF